MEHFAKLPANRNKVNIGLLRLHSFPGIREKAYAIEDLLKTVWLLE